MDLVIKMSPLAFKGGAEPELSLGKMSDKKIRTQGLPLEGDA